MEKTRISRVGNWVRRPRAGTVLLAGGLTIFAACSGDNKGATSTTAVASSVSIGVSSGSAAPETTTSANNGNVNPMEEVDPTKLYDLSKVDPCTLDYRTIFIGRNGQHYGIVDSRCDKPGLNDSAPTGIYATPSQEDGPSVAIAHNGTLLPIDCERDGGQKIQNGQAVGSRIWVDVDLGAPEPGLEVKPNSPPGPGEIPRVWIRGFAEACTQSSFNGNATVTVNN
jgi:hypothetical protein